LPAPELVPVRLQVLSGTTPAAGAIITLVSEDTAPRQPRGIVGSDGFVPLTTVTPGDGAPPGSYKVTVQWPRGAEHLTPQQLMDAAFGGDTLPDRFEGKYAHASLTPFTVTVNRGTTEIQTVTLPE